MHLPETFNLTELLDLLKPRLSCFNIHARQLSGSLYTLDLAKCYEFLSEIHKGHVSEATFQLRDFIDNKLLKASAWLSCVTEPCSIEESLVSQHFIGFPSCLTSGVGHQLADWFCEGTSREVEQYAIPCKL